MSKPNESAQAALANYAAICDIWDEANALGTVLARPEALLAKVAKLRDAMGAGSAQAPQQPQADNGTPDKIIQSLEEKLRRTEKERDGWRQEAGFAKEGVRQLRLDLDLMRAHSKGDVWVWQADGHDHLESMGKQMPVLILAGDLRAIAAAPREQAVQHRDLATRAARPGLQAAPQVPTEYQQQQLREWIKDMRVLIDRHTHYVTGAQAVLDQHLDKMVVLADRLAAPQPSPEPSEPLGAAEALTAAVDNASGCVVLFDAKGDIRFYAADGKMSVQRHERECDDCIAKNLAFSQRVAEAIARGTECDSTEKGD